MAPTGFVTRFKGKCTFDRGALWIAGSQFTGAGADLNAVKGLAAAPSTYSSTQTIPGAGVAMLLTTAAAVFQIADPVPGRPLAILALPGTTNWMVKGLTTTVTFQGGSTVQGGSTIALVMKSTVANIQQAIDLIGMSTSQWLFLGGNSTSNNANVQFSTTT